jgi:hypothetical protein
MPIEIPMVTIENSSQIREIGYDSTTKKLLVKFSSGDYYEYSGVTSDAYDQLMGYGDYAPAPGELHSVGRALNQAIKGKFEYRKLGKDEL